MKVSIITSTYNSEKFLLSSIESINNQTYFDIEHIFIDGLSKDNTLNIINKKSIYKKHLVSEKDEGIYDALNKGLKLATGDIIGIIHSDDFIANNDIIKTVVNTFNSDPNIGIVYGDLHYISQINVNRIIRKWKSSKFKTLNIYKGWMPPHPTVFIKKSLYDMYGGFDIKYKISADYDLMIRYFKKLDFKKVYIPKTFVKMRIGGESNKNLFKIMKKSQEDYQIMKNHNFKSPIKSIFFKNFSKLKQFNNK